MLRSSSHRLYSTISTASSPSSSSATRTTTTTPLLHSYQTTTPPTAQSLSLAHTIFTTHHNLKHQQHPLFTTDLFRTLPATTIPEVLLLGRSNVGKSSLLNALLGVPAKRYASESSKPGHTRTLQGWGVGDVGVVVERRGDGGGKRVRVIKARKLGSTNGLVVVDAPGYGFKSRTEWGMEMEKYLKKRVV
jgi:GTP-binding protein